MSSGTAEQSPLLVAGRWQLDHPRRRLGFGPFAQTFAGRDLQTAEHVAVKLLNEIVPAGARERFLREAQVHAELDHPAILPLLDHGRDGELLYIVTPLMSRGSLGHVVHERSDGCLSPTATLQIGRRMADALVYLREQRKTHGDISPSNILLDDRDQAFLADFGYGKAVATIPLATTGDRFGTEGYRSPRPRGEQRTYDDDVYSLAAVLWFCLTGDSPLHRHRDDLPRPLRVPLERALRWESMPTAAAFQADLEKHWKRYEHDWRLASSLSPRSRAPLVLACGLAGLLAAGVAGHALRAAPRQVPHTTLHAPALTLRLPGSWQERLPPQVEGVQLTSAVSATNAATQVTAGLSTSTGARLINDAARQALPAGARAPRRITVDGRDALRYGPARGAGDHLTELIAIPLERHVMVVSCDGPNATSTLGTTCAKAAAGAVPLDERVRPLAPTRAVAISLREAARALNRDRQHARAQIASATTRNQLRTASQRLASAFASYAASVASAPTSAYDGHAIRALARHARQASVAYDSMALATTDAQWRARRGRALARERGLLDAQSALTALGYERAPSGR